MSVETFVHEGVRGIQVELGAGSITVEPGPRDDAVEGSLSLGSEELQRSVVIRQDGDQLRILASPHQGSASAHLRLGVPAGLSYTLRTGSALVAVSADVDRAKVTTASGDISLEQAGDLDCTTGSGAVTVTRLIGRAARLGSGSGDISVSEAHCPVTAKSGSGDIIVRSLHQAELAARSGSGDIAVPSTTGSVDLRSASGSLTVGVADQLPAWLDLDSVSGAIRIALEASPEPARGEPFVRIRARTASGEIAVYRA